MIEMSPASFPRILEESHSGVIMSKPGRVVLTAACAAIVLLPAVVRPAAQSGLPNPYRPVKGLANGGGPSVPGGEGGGRSFQAQARRRSGRWDRPPQCTWTWTGKVSGL